MRKLIIALFALAPFISFGQATKTLATGTGNQILVGRGTNGADFWQDATNKAQIATATSASVQSFYRSLIWQNDGTFFYRIPNAVLTSNGVLVAACEARESTSDDGVIQIAMRRSTDGGRTWGTQYIPFPFSTPWSYGNPTFFKVPSSNRIGIVFHRHDYQDTRAELRAGTGIDVMRLFRSFSDDDGATWSAMQELTAQTEPGYSMQNIGTGAGIIETSSNRIIIGRWRCPTGGAATDYECGVIYSTNSGTSFTYSNAGSGYECQAAQTNSGHITLNARPALSGIKSRMVYTSTTSGSAFVAGGTNQLALPDPSNAASIIALSQGSRWIFINTPNTDSRSNLAWRSSQDKCVTWSDPNVINVGQMTGGYSNLVQLSTSEVGVICEGGGGLNSPITFYAFNPLTETAQEPVGVPSLVSDASARVVYEKGNLAGDALELLRSGTFTAQRTLSGTNYILDLPSGGSYTLRINGVVVFSQSGTIHAPLAVGTGTANIANIGVLNTLYPAATSPTFTGTATTGRIIATDPSGGSNAIQGIGANIGISSYKQSQGNVAGYAFEVGSSGTAAPTTFNQTMRFGQTLTAGVPLWGHMRMASGVTTLYMGFNSDFGHVFTSTQIESAGSFKSNGNFLASVAGNTMVIKRGTNGAAGVVTLTSGTASAVTTAVTGSSTVITSRLTASGVATPLIIDVSSGTAIFTGAATDNGTYNWSVIQSN